MLLSLDYEAEDNKEIINLLLECFQRPIYLRNEDVSNVIFSCSMYLHESLSLFSLCLSCHTDYVCVVAGKAIPGVSLQLERQLHLGYPRHHKKPAGVLEQVSSLPSTLFDRNLIFSSC